MMVETSHGLRVQLFAHCPTGSPTSTGSGIYDSRDGSISGAFTYSSTQIEIGQPVRYVSNGQLFTLPHGDIINTLVWRKAA